MTFDENLPAIRELIENHVMADSKDRSTKVGALIANDKGTIVSSGFNQFSPGLDENDDSLHQRPKKYAVTEHAERVAIFTAARNGRALQGTTMFMKASRELFCCAECARAMVFSGIKTLYADKPNFEDPTFGESFKEAIDILAKGGVEIKHWS